MDPILHARPPLALRGAVHRRLPRCAGGGRSSANLGGVRDGLLYGLAVFAVGSLPVYALNMASFQVSTGVVVAWVLQSLSQYLLSGLALGWYCGRVGAL